MPKQETEEPSALLPDDDVAQMLRMSTRTLRRYWKDGRMPAPVKVGSLLRWRRGDLEEWIDAGCPEVVPS